MGTPVSGTCFGVSPFWIWHFDSSWDATIAGHSPNSAARSVFQFAAKIFQRRPPRIFRRFGAGASLRVQVGATLRAKPLTVLAADGFERKGQQNLLSNYILEQQTLSLIITDLGFGAGHRHLFAAGIHAQRPIQEIKASLYVLKHRFQATGTSHLQLGGKLPVHPYVFYYLMLAVVLLDQLGTTGGMQSGALSKVWSQVDGAGAKLFVEVHRLTF